ncbi:MAG: ABC transporter substrate-binding protein [Burkholderiaceae bacterium]|nr:ABC transporter substrate-binding protein [Burkholderiaceae bacterium]
MNRKEFLRSLSAGLAAGAFVLPNKVLAQGKTRTIRIGFLAALTGFASSSERIHLQGGELARDWINSRGGIKIKGETYMVELVPEDHKSTAEGAVSGATRLVHDKGVKYVAGTIMPFTVAAVTTVTEPAGVLRSVGYNAGTPQEFSAKTPYTFLSQNGTVGAVISGMRWLKGNSPRPKPCRCSFPMTGRSSTWRRMSGSGPRQMECRSRATSLAGHSTLSTSLPSP